MVEPRKWARAAALGGFFALLLSLPQRGGAIPPGPNHGCSPYSNGGVYIPNVLTWGYFPTSWREWPGEARPDKTFPRSINKEVLPTPEGREQVPVPPAAETPPAGKGGAITVPFELTPGGGIMIPGQKLQLKEKSPPLPKEREEPSSAPTPGGVLPGLPGEPESAPSPEGPMPPKESAPPGTATPLDAPPVPDGPTPPKDAKPSGDSASSGATSARKPGSHNALRGPLTTPDGAEPPPTPNHGESVFPAPGLEMPAEPNVGQATDPRQSGVTVVRLREPGNRRLQSLTVPPDRASPVKSGFCVSAGLLPGADSLLVESIRQTSYEAPPDLADAPPVKKQVVEQPQREPSPAAQGVWRQNNPPVALGGYCPVTLGKSDRWVKGSARWSVVHQGQTYLFASPTLRECFLVDPDRYSPACSGHDPVLLVDKNLRIPGQLNYCVTYDDRLYLFSSAAELARFRQDPKHYAAAARLNDPQKKRSNEADFSGPRRADQREAGLAARALN